MKEIDRAAVDRKTIRVFGRAALLILAIVVVLAIVGAVAGAAGRIRGLLAIALAIALSSAPRPSVAEAPAASPTCPRCAPREALEACIVEKFGEYRSAAGQDVRGPIVFLFVNRGSGTWTILVTMDPAGAFACVLAAGANWRIDAGL